MPIVYDPDTGEGKSPFPPNVSGGGPGSGPGPGFGGGHGGGVGGTSGYAGAPGGTGFTGGVMQRRMDSVPAMLRPGEFVVVPEAAQHPIIQQFLQLLNSLGNQPQHFAWGGQVQGGAFQNPMQRRPGMGPTAPRMPGGGFQRPGTTPQPGAAPGGPTAAPMGQPQGGMGWTQEQQGGWGWNPQNIPGYMNLGDNPLYQRMNDMLKQFGASGAFSPQGNQQYLQAAQQQALEQGRAQQQQAANAASLYGGDPAQQAYGRMMGQIGGQNSVAAALNQANNQFQSNQQQFGQGLLSSLGGMNMQDYLARLAYEHQRLLGGK